MDFSELSRSCRTIRRFLQKPVPREVIMDILEDARVESSAMNLQVMRYVVADKPEKVEEIQPYFHFAAALPPSIGQPKKGEQPVAFIILCTEKARAHYGDIDIGISARTLQLGAWEKGVGSCILGNVEFSKVKNALQIPDEWQPVLALALGYPAHKSTIVDVPADGNIKYTVDENRDYYVPKRAMKDILKWDK